MAKTLDPKAMVLGAGAQAFHRTVMATVMNHPGIIDLVFGVGTFSVTTSTLTAMLYSDISCCQCLCFPLLLAYLLVTFAS